MGVLAILSQDIKKLSLAWWQDGVIIDEQDYRVEPDEHLTVLQDFLLKNKKNIKDVQKIFVVVGPGSFTASRISVTLANILAWAKGLLIFPFENKDEKTLKQILSEQDLETLAWQKPPVLPVYNRAPNITLKKVK